MKFINLFSKHVIIAALWVERLLKLIIKIDFLPITESTAKTIHFLTLWIMLFLVANDAIKLKTI